MEYYRGTGANNGVLAVTYYPRFWYVLTQAVLLSKPLNQTHLVIAAGTDLEKLLMDACCAPGKTLWNTQALQRAGVVALSEELPSFVVGIGMSLMMSRWWPYQTGSFGSLGRSDSKMSMA